MFMEVMRYMQDSKWFGSQKNAFLRPTALFTNNAERAFLITLCYIVLFL